MSSDSAALCPWEGVLGLVGGEGGRKKSPAAATLLLYT